MPDLVLIDGGKGQLSAVMEALRELNLDEELVVCSLAKQREEVFIPGAKEPLESEPEQLGVQLLRRLRDEAHRFAITGHRRRRAKRFNESILETVPGLGPAKRKALLLHFGGLQGILKAGRMDLERAPGVGPTLAQTLYDALHPGE